MGEFVRGLAEFHAAMDKIIAGAEEATRGAVAEAAHLIEAKAKENAPVVTGTLRRSIVVTGPVPTGHGSFSATVGPTVIYGRRIELGFHGTDSIGRHYDQSGHPYFQPGFDSAKAEMPAIFERHWAEGMYV